MKGLVIVGDKFEDVEFVAPIDVLKRHGDEIVVASVMHRLEVKSAREIIMKTDTVLENVNLDNFDFLFIPGGPGAFQILVNMKEVEKVILYFATKGKLVASICAAPMLVGRLGLFKNLNYTVYPGFESKIVGGFYQKDKGVVCDKNFITGKSMFYAIELGLEIVKYFYGEKDKINLLEQLKGNE